MCASFPGSELYSFDTAEKGSLQAFLNITLYINRPLHVSTFKTAVAVPEGGSIVRWKINGSISKAPAFLNHVILFLWLWTSEKGGNMVDKKREGN